MTNYFTWAYLIESLASHWWLLPLIVLILPAAVLGWDIVVVAPIRGWLRERHDKRADEQRLVNES